MTSVNCSWLPKLEETPNSVYMSGSYQRIFSCYDNSNPVAVSIEIDGSKLYLPLLVRDVGYGVREAYSAYGYGGGMGHAILDDYGISCLKGFLASSSIASVFIRHSPFLDNRVCFPDSVTELNRITYSVRLRLFDGIEDVLSGFSPQLRRHVNISRKNGFSARITPALECGEDRVLTFYNIYRELMTSKNAGGYYIFSDSFFVDHVVKLGNRCDLVEVFDKSSGAVVAAAFFLKDGSGWVHYHLGAGSLLAMDNHAMKLLFASAIEYYGNRGYQFMHLGGGHSLDESDGLSRFKSGFSDGRHGFYCSKIICDELIYKQERARVNLTRPELFLISDARGV